jgi:hypothetical protein
MSAVDQSDLYDLHPGSFGLGTTVESAEQGIGDDIYLA